MTGAHTAHMPKRAAHMGRHIPAHMPNTPGAHAKKPRRTPAHMARVFPPYPLRVRRTAGRRAGATLGAGFDQANQTTSTLGRWA